MGPPSRPHLSHVPSAPSAGARRIDWRAHYNAIFDVAWVPGQDRLLTASGDQSVRLCTRPITRLPFLRRLPSRMGTLAAASNHLAASDPLHPRTRACIDRTHVRVPHLLQLTRAQWSSCARSAGTRAPSRP